MVGAYAMCPGRVCFAGEDLDWLGGPSVMAAVSRYARVSVRACDGGRDIVLSGPRGEQRTVVLDAAPSYQGSFLDLAEASCRVFCQRTSRPVRGLVLDADGDLPAGAGLSSSAASSLAVLKVLDAVAKSNLSHDVLCDMAYEVEAAELRTGAGQMDFYACGHGGITYVDCAARPPMVVDTIAVPDAATLVIIDSGGRRRTRDLIDRKRRMAAANELRVTRYRDETAAIARDMRHELLRGQPSLAAVGEGMNRAHALLRDELDASTPALDRCVSAALAGGALGAKLTGAGGGGCAVALCERDTAPRVRRSCDEHSLDSYESEIDHGGLRLSADGACL
jgi:mevalonate kinase